MGQRIIYIFISCVVWGAIFYGIDQYYTPKPQKLSFEDQLAKLFEREGERKLVSSVSDSGTQFLNGHSFDVTNILEPGQGFEVSFYVNAHE